MPEVKKFRPENTAPAQFMRPPTEPFYLPLQIACLAQESAVNDTARATAAAFSYDTGLGLFRPTLKVGSELEILLFSADSDPHNDSNKLKKYNPNYSQKHHDRVQKFRKELRADSDQGGLADGLFDEGTFENLFMELRTKPSDVTGYSEVITRIQEWMQTKTEKFGIHPVIWSQHFHMSLTDDETGDNLLSMQPALDAGHRGLIDIYHRAMPLLRLPENVEDPRVIEMGSYKKGVRFQGNGTQSDPTRLEGRMNNSDYAADPYANLLLNLIGLRRGIEHIDDIDGLDNDFQLRGPLAGEQTRYFPIGKPYTEFNPAVLHAIDDPVLQEYLPQELHEGLLATVAQYWDISTRRTSVAEAREQTYDIVSRRKDPLGSITFGEPATEMYKAA